LAFFQGLLAGIAPPISFPKDFSARYLPLLCPVDLGRAPPPSHYFKVSLSVFHPCFYSLKYVPLLALHRRASSLLFSFRIEGTTEPSAFSEDLLCSFSLMQPPFSHRPASSIGRLSYLPFSRGSPVRWDISIPSLSGMYELHESPLFYCLM